MYESIMLNEICRFSAMQATATLSKFLKIPIGVDMKLIEIKKIDDINFFDKKNEQTVSIFVPITGELPGASFFIYSEQSALALCDKLLNLAEGSSQKITELEISGLTEVANIMIGNFLTHFAQSLQLNMLMHRHPDFDIGMFDTILKKRLTTFKEKMKEAVLSISFGFKHMKIQGYVLIIFSEEKIDTAIKRISAPTNV